VRVATLDVTAQLLAEFAMASQYHNGLPRRFFVKQNPLPDDVEVVSVRGTEVPGVVRLLLRSDSFDDVPEGEEPPCVPPVVYQTVYDVDYEIAGAMSRSSEAS